jgi:hypothetical protein
LYIDLPYLTQEQKTDREELYVSELIDKLGKAKPIYLSNISTTDIPTTYDAWRALYTSQFEIALQYPALNEKAKHWVPQKQMRALLLHTAPDTFLKMKRDYLITMEAASVMHQQMYKLTVQEWWDSFRNNIDDTMYEAVNKNRKAFFPHYSNFNNDILRYKEVSNDLHKRLTDEEVDLRQSQRGKSLIYRPVCKSQQHMRSKTPIRRDTATHMGNQVNFSDNLSDRYKKFIPNISSNPYKTRGRGNQRRRGRGGGGHRPTRNQDYSKSRGGRGRGRGRGRGNGKRGGRGGRNYKTPYSPKHQTHVNTSLEDRYNRFKDENVLTKDKIARYDKLTFKNFYIDGKCFAIYKDFKGVIRECGKHGHRAVHHEYLYQKKKTWMNKLINYNQNSVNHISITKQKETTSKQTSKQVLKQDDVDMVLSTQDQTTLIELKNDLELRSKALIDMNSKTDDISKAIKKLQTKSKHQKKKQNKKREKESVDIKTDRIRNTALMAVQANHDKMKKDTQHTK